MRESKPVTPAMTSDEPTPEQPAAGAKPFRIPINREIVQPGEVARQGEASLFCYVKGKVQVVTVDGAGVTFTNGEGGSYSAFIEAPTWNPETWPAEGADVEVELFRLATLEEAVVVGTPAGNNFFAHPDTVVE